MKGREVEGKKLEGNGGRKGKMEMETEVERGGGEKEVEGRAASELKGSGRRGRKEWGGKENGEKGGQQIEGK